MDDVEEGSRFEMEDLKRSLLLDLPLVDSKRARLVPSFLLRVKMPSGSTLLQMDLAQDRISIGDIKHILFETYGLEDVTLFVRSVVPQLPSTNNHHATNGTALVLVSHTDSLVFNTETLFFLGLPPFQCQEKEKKL